MLLVGNVGCYVLCVTVMGVNLPSHCLPPLQAVRFLQALEVEAMFSAP